MITSAEEWETYKAFSDLATELREGNAPIKPEDMNKLLKLLNAYVECPERTHENQRNGFQEFDIVMKIYQKQRDADIDREI